MESNLLKSSCISGVGVEIITGVDVKKAVEEEVGTAEPSLSGVTVELDGNGVITGSVEASSDCVVGGIPVAWQATRSSVNSINGRLFLHFELLPNTSYNRQGRYSRTSMLRLIWRSPKPWWGCCECAQKPALQRLLSCPAPGRPGGKPPHQAECSGSNFQQSSLANLPVGCNTGRYWRERNGCPRSARSHH